MTAPKLAIHAGSLPAAPTIVPVCQISPHSHRQSGRAPSDPSVCTNTYVLRAKAIASTAPARPPSDQRCGQFPIALAAPSVPYPPQFRALALFGRRPPERVVGIVGAGIRKPAHEET